MTGIEAGKGYVKFLLEDKEFQKGLKGIGTKLQNVGKIGMAATAPLIAGFTAATAAFVATGDELEKMSQRTGFAVETLSGLKYAADQSGTSLAGIDKAAKKMATGILDADKGTGGLYESLGTLGVSLDALQKQTPEQQFLTLSDAISRVENPTLKAALAQKVFGRAGTELLPMLNDGAKGVFALMRRHHELGLEMSGPAAHAAVELGDNLADLKEQVFAMAEQIGAAIAGPITDFAKYLQPILAGVINWIKLNPEWLVTIAKVTAAIGAASIATYGLGIAMAVVSKAPLLLMLTGVAAAVWAVVEAYQAWSKWITKVVDAAAGGIPWAPGSGPNQTAAGAMNDGAMQQAAINAQANAMIAEATNMQAAAKASLPGVGAPVAVDPAEAAVMAEVSGGMGKLVEIEAKALAVLNGMYSFMRNQKTGLIANWQ